MSGENQSFNFLGRRLQAIFTQLAVDTSGGAWSRRKPPERDEGGERERGVGGVVRRLVREAAEDE